MTPAEVDVQELELQIERWHAQVAYTQWAMQNTQIESFFSSTLPGLVVRIQQNLLYLEDDRGDIEVPADWWEHFKERWFPQWALKRWPVRYRHWRARWYFPDPEIKGIGTRIAVFRDATPEED